MSADRPFPPSARRLGLARRSGLHAASAVLVGGAAVAAVAIAIAALAVSAFDRLAATVAAALRGETHALPAELVPAVLAIAMPFVGAAALAAIVAHFAQTRAVWIPKRRIDGAPALAGGSSARTRRAAFELASAGVIGAVAFGWLWVIAPRLAALPVKPYAGAALIASALAAFAVAWIAIGVIDALLRHAELAGALRMTPREKREDERLSGADPRWRELRARLGREPTTPISAATVLVLGDDLAVAIAWDPVRQPRPQRTAIGAGVRSTQLLGLARRYRIPVHRDPTLAAALATGKGPVPESHWPRLAEIVAALRR
jgi:flagellar biosynthesis protein FlhB